MPLACFDDEGISAFACDILINQNAGAENWAKNACPPLTRPLLGTQFSMIRKEFRAQRERGIALGKPRLVITFGGSDRANLGLAAMEALDDLSLGFEGVMVCTAGARGLEEARRFAGGSRLSWTVLPGVNSLAPLLEPGTAVLCGGGSTTLELAYLGIPMVIVTIAANQLPGSEALANAGAALLAGEGREGVANARDGIIEIFCSPDRSHGLSARGKHIVDGFGASRVASFMGYGSVESKGIQAL
jgi:spore coat polysaccharide biosynthesis predicted glycosyltransferase SpsG